MSNRIPFADAPSNVLYSSGGEDDENDESRRRRDDDETSGGDGGALNESEQRALRVWNRSRPANKAVEIYEKEAMGRRDAFLIERRRASLRFVGFATIGVALLAVFVFCAGVVGLGTTISVRTPARDVCEKDSKCFALLRVISVELSRHAGLAACGVEGYKEENVSMRQIENLVYKTHQDKDWTGKDLENVLTSFLTNPKWNIRILNYDGVPLSGTILGARSLVSLFPQRPLLCQIFATIRESKPQLITALLSLLAFTAISMFYVESSLQAAKAMFALVDIILRHLHDRYLITKSSRNVSPLLSVSETKTKLLKSVKKLPLSLWGEAIEWISLNESRVKIEKRDDRYYWQWIDINANHYQTIELSDDEETKETNNKKNVLWQGKALEHYPRHVARRLTVKRVRPTICIKLRNVFNPRIEPLSQSRVVEIENAILEKCSQLGGITHLHVSEKSKEGTVYLKCHSVEDSCEIRDGLNGTWFNGSLISATYVQVSRYHERFPEARKVNKVLFATT